MHSPPRPSRFQTQIEDMTRISSGSTFLYKRIFPIFWFGILAFFVVTFASSGAFKYDLTFLILPCVMGVFGFVMMKKLIWDLVDEVYDGGDFLVVKNRGDEERIALSDIVNVSAAVFMNPPRVTLRLARPSKFGEDIVFSPVTGLRLFPFGKIAVVEDLITRVDQARRA